MPLATRAMDKPIVAFTFDNIKGDLVPDVSGNRNDGTMQNNPNEIGGKTGKALEFDGSRVRIAASDTVTTEMFAEGIFTVTMWIKAKRAGGEWQQVFRAGPNANDTLFVNNNGLLSWRGMVNAAWAGGMCETAAGLVEADGWTHAAVTGDAKKFQIFVNGELAKEADFQETMGNNQEYMIGGYAGAEQYSGAVDEFAIFKETLSEAEINAVMNKGILNATAVEPDAKLATSWGEIKNIK